jgi:hypothetical protein
MTPGEPGHAENIGRMGAVWAFRKLRAQRAGGGAPPATPGAGVLPELGVCVESPPCRGAPGFALVNLRDRA